MDIYNRYGRPGATDGLGEKPQPKHLTSQPCPKSGSSQITTQSFTIVNNMDTNNNTSAMFRSEQLTVRQVAIQPQVGDTNNNNNNQSTIITDPSEANRRQQLLDQQTQPQHLISELSTAADVPTIDPHTGTFQHSPTIPPSHDSSPLAPTMARSGSVVLSSGFTSSTTPSSSSVSRTEDTKTASSCSLSSPGASSMGDSGSPMDTSGSSAELSEDELGSGSALVAPSPLDSAAGDAKSPQFLARPQRFGEDNSISTLSPQQSLASQHLSSTSTLSSPAFSSSAGTITAVSSDDSTLSQGVDQQQTESDAATSSNISTMPSGHVIRRFQLDRIEESESEQAPQHHRQQQHQSQQQCQQIAPAVADNQGSSRTDSSASYHRQCGAKTNDEMKKRKR